MIPPRIRPAASQRTLSFAVRAMLCRWIHLLLFACLTVTVAHAATAEEKWWAFQLPKEPATPHPSVDEFWREGLKAKNLVASAPADRRTLIRRAYFDLLGLPPKNAEVEAFAEDTRPNAYERLIERLLASPHY